MTTEIGFSILSKKTHDLNCLILELGAIEKENYTFSFTNYASEKPINYWKKLAVTPIDQETLSFLLAQESLYLSKHKMQSSSSFHIVHIMPQAIDQAFALLARTQKVFCEGKRLVIDLYSPVDFFYQGTILSDNTLEIEGCVRIKEKTVALSDCAALIPSDPPSLIHGISLKKISTDISWKQLKALKDNKLHLRGEEKQHFLSEINSDNIALEMTNTTNEALVEMTLPYPILRLTDKRGSFAELFMDYGEGTLFPFDQQIESSTKTKRFNRNKIEETKWEKDLLETDFSRKLSSNSHYYCPLDKVGKSLTFLLELGWTIQDWQNRKVIKDTGLNLDLQDNQHFVEIKGNLRYDTYQANLKDIVGAFNRRDQFISLSDSTVGLLPEGKIQQDIQDLSQEAEWISDTLRLKKSHLGSIGNLWNSASQTSTLQSLKDKWENFSHIEEALPTTEFQGQLRPYQQEGVNWLSFLETYDFHGILADEMGLGKTVQILAFLSRLPRDLTHLIILPTSLLFNWRSEISRFLPSFNITLHHGPKRSTIGGTLQVPGIVLCTYATMRIDLELLRHISFHCLILDEAQTIKNAHTQTSKAVCELNAKRRLSITGTPVENRLDELWSHFHFLIPDLFSSEEIFQQDLLASQSDRRYLERIKRKIAPFLLKRTKAQVATDLPLRTDQVVTITMENDQRDFYEELLAKCKNGLLKKVQLEGAAKHRMEIFETILRLRQACCHPQLISSMLEGKESTRSAKFDALMEDLETLVEEGKKTIVFSQFTSMLHLMSQYAKKANWTYAYLDGSTKNREEEVTRFQTDSAVSIFFISLKAGGVGLNLTKADYIYLYDPWWNEAVEEQAINRAHRIGSQNPIIAKRLIVADSIEEKMMTLKQAKQKVIGDLFDDEVISSALTIEDLEFLLN